MVGLAVVAVAITAVFFGGTASAQSDRSEAVAFAHEVCREAQEEGVLDELGLTFGECINLVSGPASENANNQIAAFCGAEIIQEFTETTNKGQCIKVFKEIFEP